MSRILEKVAFSLNIGDIYRNEIDRRIGSLPRDGYKDIPWAIIQWALE